MFVVRFLVCAVVFVCACLEKEDQDRDQGFKLGGVEKCVDDETVFDERGLVRRVC